MALFPPRITRQIASAALLALTVGLLAAAPVRAQIAGLQMTPDSGRYLINKDVGNERWAISFNLNDRTVTGNVFRTDGPPAFVWCEIKHETPSPVPAQTQYLLDCFGADACLSAPCTPDQWTRIATDLPIGGDFLLPPGTLSTFGGNVQPIFNARCATSGCHIGAAPAAGLNLEQGKAYNNIFLRLSSLDPDHFLISPFDAGTSHLYGLLTGEEEGTPMPLGGPPLPADQITAVRNWILEGAADN